MFTVLAGDDSFVLHTQATAYILASAGPFELNTIDKRVNDSSRLPQTSS